MAVGFRHYANKAAKNPPSTTIASSVSPETAGQSSQKCRASRKCLSFKAYVRFEPSRFTQPFDIQHHIVISSPLCVFLESKLNVQANMTEPNNGQLSPKDNELFAPKGSQARYTGELLLRTRPKTYRAIVRELAEPNASVNGISRRYRVSNHTVMGIREREAKSIAERKKHLVSLLADVATVGAERMSEKIGKASLRDAAIGTGIAVDKMLALTGQTPAIQIANIQMPSEEEREERRAVHKRLDEIARRLMESCEPKP